MENSDCFVGPLGVARRDLWSDWSYISPALPKDRGRAGPGSTRSTRWRAPPYSKRSLLYLRVELYRGVMSRRASMPARSDDVVDLCGPSEHGVEADPPQTPDDGPLSAEQVRFAVERWKLPSFRVAPGVLFSVEISPKTNIQMLRYFIAPLVHENYVNVQKRLRCGSSWMRRTQAWTSCCTSP